MRFVFLIITLGFGGLFFSTALHADVLHPAIDHHQFIPSDPAFDAVKKAYKEFNYPEAIHLTKKLRRQKKDLKIAKVATFLLGDIYFDIASNGRPLEYKRALIAFQGARSRYRDSEEAIRALWKIGTVYLRQRLFYEALASFNMILKKHSQSRFIIAAQFGKAQTFLTWKKYDKAITEYDSIDPTKLKHAEKMALLLGYGDTYQQMNMVNMAYRYYKMVPINDAILQKLPVTIFQYGISALRSGDYRRAITLLSILQNRYPGGPDTLQALARIGDAWRLQGMSHRANNIYKLVRRSQKHNTNGQIAKIIAELGTLHLAGCSPRPILLSESDCKKMKPLSSKAGLAALERIAQKAKVLFSSFDNPTPRTRLHLVEGILFETITGLEQHKAYTFSLQIKEQFLKKKIHKNTRKKIEGSLQQTVIQATSQLLEEDEPVAVLTTFFGHRSQYSGEILNSHTGLQIGIRLTKAGFYQEAADILRPIAELKHNETLGDALYYLVKANYGLGKYQAAEQNLKRYIKTYPSSQRKAALLILSAEISEHEGLRKQAIKKYRAWLKQYPQDKRVQKIRLALARNHEQDGDLPQAITSYLKVVKAGGTKVAKFQLKAADLYFRLAKYREAASYYEKSLKISEAGPQKEWAQVQLANSYAALGQQNLGRPLFTQLVEQATDDIIKGFSEQKLALEDQ